MIEAAQVAQDAQAGNARDHCTKRSPMAFNNVKDVCKGHQTLFANRCKDCADIIGKRHAMRLMSDAYGKGIVRGHVEHTTLRAYGKLHQVTAAEAIATCLTTAFYGKAYFVFIERLIDTQPRHEQQFVNEACFFLSITM